MIHRPFVLTSRLGEPIRGDLRFLESRVPRPTIVVCHGFKGFKDWGFHPWLGETLAASGFVAVHFNFSRNGVGEDLLNFTELESFRTNTYSIELDDVETVLDALPTAFPDAPIDASRIGLLGHSRGGGIAVLAAAERPAVRALVTWSGVSTLERVTDPAQLALWRSQGHLDVPNLRTGQILQMGIGLLDDLTTNTARLDVRRAVARLSCPYRIVHGSLDETVPLSEAETLLASSAGRATLAVVPGGTHTFGAVHPFAGPTPQLEEAAREAVQGFSVLST